jgi:tetratricopeptide (TPR) repeat protein
MRKILLLTCVMAASVLLATHASKVSAADQNENQPNYTKDGKLVLPPNYREWFFLTSGLGMNYSTGVSAHPMFTNVFVPPEAYKEFKSTGKWPDKTQFVLEIVQPATHGSINKGGHYQNALMGWDVEVKDSTRPQQWTYYNYDAKDTQADPISSTACLKCHSANAAVENTFVQFYPTLLDFAVERGLIKPGLHVPLNQSRFVKLIVNSGWEKAEAAYREVHKLNPESDLMDMAALENTAGSLAKDKKMKEAIQVVTLMTKEYPASAQAYDDLGDVYKMDSQAQPAIEASQKALSLVDSDAKLSADDKKQVRSSSEKRIAELSKK